MGTIIDKKENTNHNKRMNMIWPLFNSIIKTRVGKLFINLIEKHFPKKHILIKVFNRNSVKLIYSLINNDAVNKDTQL